MKTKLNIILTIFFLHISFIDLYSNRERPYSLNEMTKKSFFIIDCEVFSVNQKEEKIINFDNGSSSFKRKYMAEVKVHKNVKGLSLDTVRVMYWVRGNNYKGDRVSKLNVGDKFRLFIHLPNTIIKNENDEVEEVEIYTANQVRPEAYGRTIDVELKKRPH